MGTSVVLWLKTSKFHTRESKMSSVDSKEAHPQWLLLEDFKLLLPLPLLLLTQPTLPSKLSGRFNSSSNQTQELPLSFLTIPSPSSRTHPLLLLLILSPPKNTVLQPLLLPRSSKPLLLGRPTQLVLVVLTVLPSPVP